MYASLSVLVTIGAGVEKWLSALRGPGWHALICGLCRMTRTLRDMRPDPPRGISPVTSPKDRLTAQHPVAYASGRIG